MRRALPSTHGPLKLLRGVPADHFRKPESSLDIVDIDEADGVPIALGHDCDKSWSTNVTFNVTETVLSRATVRVDSVPNYGSRLFDSRY